MNRAQARREANALAAEWIDAWLRTDDGWREAYTEAEQVEVREEVESLRDRLEEAGPSAFFRQREAARSASAPKDDGDALLVDGQGRRVCEDRHLCGSGCGTGPCSRRCRVCLRLAFTPTAPCPACPDAPLSGR